MFSENNRISGRQAFRLLTYDLLGLGTLIVPQILGRTAGVDGIFSIGIGVAISLFYLKLLNFALPEAQMDFFQYLKQSVGRVVSCLVLLGCLIYFVMLAGYTAYLFADVVLAALLREESFYLVLVILMALAGYGLWGGIEGRARSYEILFWFIILPLFFMLFFALDEIQTDYWAPVFIAGAGSVLAGSYAVFQSFSVVFLLLFLRGYMEKKKVVFLAGRAALLFSGAIYAALYLILLGIFGAGALAQMEYPAVTLMSTVKISGGFLKRTDAFMFAVWFFTLYALLTSCIFFSGNVLERMAEPLWQKCGQKKGAYGVVLLLVFALACCFYKSPVCLSICETFFCYIGTPFLAFVSILLAVVRFFSKEDGKKWARRGMGMAVILFLSGGVITGCGTAQLEERNFPIEIAVQEPENFAAEWKEAQGLGNRVIDYSHLKVLVLSRAFLEDEAGMREFLQFMERENEVPRNAYVVAAEDAETLLEQAENAGESLGNYLEEQFENVSEMKKQAYPTLGNLYQEKENRCETLFIPYAVPGENGTPKIEEYYVWKRGRAAGLVDRETARLAFFTENCMENYTVPLPDGLAVTLFGSHNEVGFRESGARREIVVTIRCSGELSGGAQETKLRQEETVQQLEQYMNELAQKTLLEREIDLSGSYRKLAGMKRGWYQEYQNQDAVYEQDMSIVYEMKIDWVNF